MKAQKLGRGLGALLGEIDEAYENELSSRDSVVELSIKDIRPNPYQPRRHFDEESLLELSESILHDGLIQPIVVTEDIDGYILIAGERRLRASKIAKLKSIKAIVVGKDDRKMRQFALIENIQREDLNPIDLALAYSELIKLHEITQDELSSRINKSRSHIANTLRLMSLSQKTQRAIVEKKISAGHAKVLVGLSEKEQQVMVDTIIGQKLSVRDVESAVQNLKSKEQKTPTKQEIEKLDLETLSNYLRSDGFSIKCGAKKVTIEFDSQDDIQRLIKFFE
ncbi:MAG: ParB/RepB/Spo0J family partition protein [Sulfuricurvum sp.]